MARRVSLCDGDKRSTQYSMPLISSLGLRGRYIGTVFRCRPHAEVCRSIPFRAKLRSLGVAATHQNVTNLVEMACRPPFAAPITGNVRTHFILRCRYSRSNAVRLATEDGNNFVAWQCTSERIDKLLHLIILTPTTLLLLHFSRTIHPSLMSLTCFPCSSKSFKSLSQ
jgi:hypothetical protein